MRQKMMCRRCGMWAAMLKTTDDYRDGDITFHFISLLFLYIFTVVPRGNDIFFVWIILRYKHFYHHLRSEGIAYRRRHRRRCEFNWIEFIRCCYILWKNWIQEAISEAHDFHVHGRGNSEIKVASLKLKHRSKDLECVRWNNYGRFRRDIRQLTQFTFDFAINSQQDAYYATISSYISTYAYSMSRAR